MSVPSTVQFKTLMRLNKADLVSIVVRMNEIITGYHKQLGSLKNFTMKDKIDRPEIEEIIRLVNHMYLINLLNPYEGVYETKLIRQIMRSLFGT